MQYIRNLQPLLLSLPADTVSQSPDQTLTTNLRHQIYYLETKNIFYSYMMDRLRRRRFRGSLLHRLLLLLVAVVLFGDFGNLDGSSFFAVRGVAASANKNGVLKQVT